MSSIVLQGFIAALLAIIAYTTSKQLTVLEKKDGGFQIIDADKKVIADIPSIKLEPFRFGKIFIKRISGIVGTKKPDVPQFSFKSIDRDIRIFIISLVPDATFKTKGIMQIKSNKADLLEPTDAGVFTDLLEFSIPIPENGILLQRGESIEFFFWTSDGTSSAITLAGFVGEHV